MTIKWAEGEARKLGINNVKLHNANKLFIANIPVTLNQNEFFELLSRFGTIRVAKFHNYKNDPNKRFCFLKFTTKE